MNAAQRQAASHAIAERAGHQIVQEGIAAQLSWIELCIAMETTLAAVVSACVVLSGHHAPERLATELVDSISERALVRAISLLRMDGTPTDKGH